MQLDRTEIVIRERSTLELFDLSLQVLKRHWMAIALSSALFGIPLLILNSLATAWMLDQNSLELAEQAHVPAAWREAWHLTILYVLQFPLISLPTTIYLGNRIFYQALPIRQLLRRLWPIAGRCLLVLGILRLGLVGLVLELFIDRQVAFDFQIEFWFFTFAAGLALLNRATRPFAPEILGLELCPLRAKSAGTISYRVRSRALHRYTVSQNLPRFLWAACFACLLYAMLDGAQSFLLGTITGRWSGHAGLDHLGMQLSLWCVGLFLAVFRFLSYLDSRIRLEGWELELRLKAEATRLAAATYVGAGPGPVPGVVRNAASADRILANTAVKAGSQSAVQGGLVVAVVLWLCSATPLAAATTSLTATASVVELAPQSERAAQLEQSQELERAAQSLPIGEWYDKQAERFRPPEVAPADDDPVRTQGSRSPSLPATVTDLESANQPWMANWPGGESAQFLQRWLFILLAIGLIVLLAWLSYYSLRDYLPEKYTRRPVPAVSFDPARIADLPFDSQPTANDPLSAARRAMQSDNYDQAIAYLLGYMLLTLDQRRLIHLQRGKTNRMYLRELSNQPILAAIVHSAVAPFEASYFGKHSITREQFMSAWQQVDNFQQQLQSAPSASPSADNTAPTITPPTSTPPISAPQASTTSSVSSGAGTQSGKLTLGLLLGLSCLGSAGCGFWSSDAHPYGAVTSPYANRSLNGLGLHRKLWESQGAKCSTLSQLSPRLDQADVIVLVGQSYQPPGIEARRWLEQWLAEGEQRTLIYFGRDFNADILYRQQTLAGLPDAQRQRGGELLALRQAEELRARWMQLPEVVFCDWFYIDSQRATHDYRQFESDWIETEQFAEAVAADVEAGRWPVGVALQPPDSELWRDKLTQQLHLSPDTAASTALPSEGDPISPVAGQDSPDPPRRSHWSPDEFGDQSQRLDALQDPLESEILLAADDGQALIFRLTAEASQYARLGNGQIVIVANGFPLLNGSLVTHLGARLGEQLIDLCGPAERVALVAYGEGGLLISGTDESGLSGAGMEMLTVWPLSAITMPAALLGIIVCAALWPILGRPQPLAKRSVSDLGLHVEAIGRLMSETHDRQYAAGAIDEYFRRVRGETPPAWLSEVVQDTNPAPARLPK